MIKFFKKKHLTPKKWLKYIDLPYLSDYRYIKLEKRQQNLNRMFDIMKTAFDEFKEDVGFVYIHLSPTKNLKINLHLQYNDKEFRANLDELPFLVQETAELLYTRLNRLMKKNDTAGMLNAMRSLLHLIRIRGERGFIDIDNNFGDNFGFVGERAIQIDLGCLAPTQNRSSTIQEIQRTGKELKRWVESNCPQLLPDLENLIREFAADNLRVQDSNKEYQNRNACREISKTSNCDRFKYNAEISGINTQ